MKAGKLRMVVDAPPSGAKVITMTDEEIARATLPDGDAAVKAMKTLQGKTERPVEYELTPDGRLMKVLDPTEVLAPEGGSEEDSVDVSRQEGDAVSEGHPDGEIVDLLAERSNYFSEDAMEFVLSAIDSGVDERAVRRMIAMDEGELLRICGEVE